MTHSKPNLVQAVRNFLPEELKRFIRFSIVGVGNTTIDFGLYFILTRFFLVYYLAANVVSWITAVCFSFIANKFWTFRSFEKKDTIRQYARFLAVNIAGLIMSVGLLYIFVEHVGISDLIGKILTIAFITFWNFFMNKYWTFNNR